MQYTEYTPDLVRKSIAHQQNECTVFIGRKTIFVETKLKHNQCNKFEVQKLFVLIS